MGVRYPSVGTTTIANATLTNGVEIVVATTPPLNIALDFALVMLFWYVMFATGATTTAYRPLLRRGVGTGGSAVNVANTVNSAGGTNVLASGVYFDTPGAVGAQQYSFTLINSGGAGNGAVLDVSLLAISL